MTDTPRTPLTTMFIKTDTDHLTAISLPNMEDRAEFSENNIAQVTEKDGKVLLDKHPDVFSEHETEDN